MKPRNVVAVLVLGAILLAGGAVAAGILPWGDASTRPPCEQLPDRNSVTSAVASHQGLVARIESVGPGVKVDVATPCKDQPERAIVSLKYKTEAERKGIEALLRQEDGFGVELELVKR
jgi:hypothetical protein